MIQQEGELVAGDVVAPAGEQDRLRHDPATEQLLDAAREFAELASVVERRGIGHVFDAIPPVRDGLDVVAVLVLELLEHVVERVVEPRVALGDQHAGGARECSGDLGGHTGRCGLDANRPGCPAPLRARQHGFSLLEPFVATGEHSLRTSTADLQRVLDVLVREHGDLLVR